MDVIERKRKGRCMKNNFFIVVDCFLGDDLSKVFATKNKSYGSFPEAKFLKLRGCFYIDGKSIVVARNIVGATYSCLLLVFTFGRI
jgi:hypothetical protein